MAEGHISYRLGADNKKSYFYRIPLPPGTDGKRRSETKRGFKTERAAQQARTKRLAEIAASGYAEQSKLTLAQYSEQWLEFQKDRVTLPTHLNYGRMLRLHILPYLGAARLQSLRAVEIEQAWARLRREGRSVSLIKHVHGVLSNVLNNAERLDLIAKNPCRRAKLPQEPREIEEDDEEEVRALTVAELQQLLATARGWLRPVLLIALATGMRRGELLALRWQDVDLDACELRVRRTVQWVSGHGLVFGPPKTKKSRRTIALSPLAVTELRRLKGEQAAQRLALGPVWDDHGLVFPGKTGCGRNPNRVSESWRRLGEKCGIACRFHDLRHSHTTFLMAAGVPDTIVSGRLGHKTSRITREVYQHMLPGMQGDAAAATDLLLQRLLEGEK